MDYDPFDALVQHLFRKTQGDAWFKPSEENVSAGVCLRVEPGLFRVFPYDNPYLVPFEAAVRALNPLVAIKVRSAAVHAALASVPEDATAIYIDHDTRIQILDRMEHLPQAEKEQCGAFLRDERVLIVWSDDINSIVPLCTDFADKLVTLVWRARTEPGSMITSTTPSVAPSANASGVNLADKTFFPDITEAATTAAVDHAQQQPPAQASKWWWSWKLGKRPTTTATAAGDAEKQSASARPIRQFAAVYSGLAAGLSLFFVANGLTTLLAEWRLDGNYRRFGLMATGPFLVCVALIFCLNVINAIFFTVGPVAQYHENSRYYSAVQPEPNPAVDQALPHVTVEIPVYKESLEETIAPSVFSIKKAMQTYARQGGTSAIFIHDDGLQIVDEAERIKRIQFYTDHGIGWVARPKHSSAPGGFFRAGRFKKASNMNYGLALSLRMESHIATLEERERNGEDLELGPDEALEDRALHLAVEELAALSGHRPWAANGRALRVGEIILICDADTMVPEDCFRDAARELAECPDVAIIQHESDVMQVAHHFFENGIAYFTRRINKCISMSCANGEVAPFVGHNAFLRWSAIQDAAFIDVDGVTKIWSESNVSEDFDMALRLQLQGYIIRWATYSEGGFKEGVSLTVADELNRWQKYAYGCNELIFNPLKDWWRMGPIHKQFRTFIWSDAPVHYKISMSSYIFSYYGIAATAFLSTLNYLLLGFALEGLDGFYMHSFEIWLACIVVFPCAGNISFTILEYRLGVKSILAAGIENFIWVPFFFFFFGGLSIHLSTALLAHMFSYNMTWGATIKEVQRSNFWIEVPEIWKRFRLALCISFALIAMMIVLSLPVVTPAWQIPGTSWAVILPLAIVASGHILFPIVLNPWLMIFSY